jgi:hypothetical protein
MLIESSCPKQPGLRAISLRFLEAERRRPSGASSGGSHKNHAWVYTPKVNRYVHSKTISNARQKSQWSLAMQAPCDAANRFPFWSRPRRNLHDVIYNTLVGSHVSPHYNHGHGCPAVCWFKSETFFSTPCCAVRKTRGHCLEVQMLCHRRDSLQARHTPARTTSCMSRTCDIERNVHIWDPVATFDEHINRREL